MVLLISISFFPISFFAQEGHGLRGENVKLETDCCNVSGLKKERISLMCLTHLQKKETLACGDSNMRNLQRGEVLQLERKGYFRCDVPFTRPSKPIVLFAIPDGRQQTSLKKFLLEVAAKVGIEGAEEFLKNPNNGLKEVEDELKTYSGNISGVPYYVINGNQKLSGAQPPEVFLRAFQVAAS